MAAGWRWAVRHGRCWWVKLSAVRQLRGGRIAELRGKAARLADKADLVGG
jgi:hypothetical protein